MKIHKLDIVPKTSILVIFYHPVLKLFWTNPNNPEKKNVFGVLPYIAPEILSDLAMKICNGLQPKIPFYTPKLITRTITRSNEELTNTKTTTITTPLNYRTHPHHMQVIPVDFLIIENFQNPRTKKILKGNLKN
ncbi:hypothetical protein Glove_228g110 [Diversispora epigaea]|uniref:Protein kinase domain-containing protein n=1 Tax=Diversispora epigaea TaxID=1348612 RepID=A0A397II15_9GLOM|nr:hypothetical protein Glove_228g110 [Diversispora epigaea]